MDKLREHTEYILKKYNVDMDDADLLRELTAGTDNKDNIEEIVEVFHTLMCNNHEDGSCDWYTEVQMANPWEKKSHKWWMEYTLDIMEESGISIEDANEILQQLGKLIAEVNKCDKRVVLLLRKYLGFNIE